MRMSKGGKVKIILFIEINFKYFGRGASYIKKYKIKIVEKVCQMAR